MSDEDLGTSTRKIINGRILRCMQIVSEATVLETDMKESDVVSDLMMIFPLYPKRTIQRFMLPICCLILKKLLTSSTIVQFHLL